ncbi:pyridoxine 5'-phosphate synthase [bacterium]|nr:pyridoxine 5'-phosphate synthase [bacterium]
MHKRLGLNVDHVATLRQARKWIYPDPVIAASIAEIAGAYGIVCHLREDRRHINDRDLKTLREVIKRHLNLEMANTREMVKIALQTKPEMVTLVPEKREELTTEGGLDVVKYFDEIRLSAGKFNEAGIVTSLFIDSETEQIKASAEIGAKVIELHTGTYANAKNEQERNLELQRLKEGAVYGKKLGLKISAGHGLDYQNIFPILEIPHVEEFNIGFSIIARSVYVGISQAVKEMVSLLNSKN